MAEAAPSVSTRPILEAKPAFKLTPQRLQDLARSFRSDILDPPNNNTLKELRGNPLIYTTITSELHDAAEANDPLRAWDAAMWYQRLDLKIPDPQFQDYITELLKRCEGYMDTNHIPYKPIPREHNRRWMIKGGLATAAGLAAAVGGKVGYDFINYGKQRPAVAVWPPQASQNPETPAAPPTPEAQVNNFNDLIKPVIDEVNKRRAERARTESDYHRVVDKELNQNLINIGLVAWSEGHGEALTVLSYNTVTGEVTSVSCTRETVTPTVNRYLDQHQADKSKDPWRGPFATNMFLYHAGGFSLMRRVIEEETGLSADLQIYMTDTILHDFIERVLGNSIEIEIKNEITIQPFSFNKWGYKPEAYTLNPGKYKMTADEALSYILSADTKLIADKGNQPPGRKNNLIMAVFNKTREQLRQDPAATLTAISGFMQDKLPKGEVAADFNIAGLIAAVGYRAGLAKLRGVTLKLPPVNPNDLMLNDEFFGDGGMIRVNRLIDEKSLEPEKYQAHAHPNVQKLIDQTIAMSEVLTKEGVSLDDPKDGLLARGVLPVWLQVPIMGDPEAQDLVTGYWQSTRQLTRQRLLK